MAVVTRARAATTFRERLCEARRLQGLTQAKVEQLAHLPRTTVIRFERGARRPSLENLRRLCLALHVSADWLLGLKDNADVDPK